MEHTAIEEAMTIRDTIDLMVQAGEDQYPVMASTLVKVSVASWKQLDELEEAGHIRSIMIDVPSVLVPTKTVKEKAYYTERRIPKLVENIQPKTN